MTTIDGLDLNWRSATTVEICAEIRRQIPVDDVRVTWFESAGKYGSFLIRITRVGKYESFFYEPAEVFIPELQAVNFIRLHRCLHPGCSKIGALASLCLRTSDGVTHRFAYCGNHVRLTTDEYFRSARARGWLKSESFETPISPPPSESAYGTYARLNPWITYKSATDGQIIQFPPINEVTRTRTSSNVTELATELTVLVMKDGELRRVLPGSVIPTGYARREHYSSEVALGVDTILAIGGVSESIELWEAQRARCKRIEADAKRALDEQFNVARDLTLGIETQHRAPFYPRRDPFTADSVPQEPSKPVATANWPEQVSNPSWED